MQIPILNGVYTGQAPDFRTSYPRNLVPVPKQTGIATGYLRPADGLVAFGTGPGADRGGINWDGTCYRVMGSSLVSVSAAGVVTVLGNVGTGPQVTLDYSFDRLAVASGGGLYYWNGSTLTKVTDTDLGFVVDMCWIAGYFLLTDGTNLIVTELNDPTSINPLKYGSAESDPDPVFAVDELRNEAYAFGRFTIEVFQNVGGDGFPFERIEGAQVPRGILGTHCYSLFLNSFAFLGSGRNEAPAVFLMIPGDTQKLSTREIDQILAGYTEAQLSVAVMETRIDKGHQHLLLHLPDRCLVYDASASAAVQEPVWFTQDSGFAAPATYRARGLVWCYDEWLAGDPTGTSVVRLDSLVASHLGQKVGWDFGTLVLYAEGNDAIVHELELVCLPGRAAFGDSPTIWTSYSHDGSTWSQERPISAGAFGERLKRLAWRNQGRLRHYRMQRFRGDSDSRLAITRIEAAIEPLRTRPANG